MGDSIAHCARAIKEISHDHRVSRLTPSSFYSTSPVSPVPQDDFINAAVAFDWDGSPVDLLRFLGDIEQRMGRIRHEAWGPRIIDLDILLLGDTVLDTPSLTIPHPELHRRKFALVPCLEIEPALMHPFYGKPLVSFLHEIDEEQRVSLSVRAEDVGRL